MSCATAGGLTYLFADINTSQAASQTIAALPAALPIATAPMPSNTSVSTTPAPVVPALAIQAYNGDLVNTKYGPVQVQLQFTNGAISEVAVVAYPNGDDKSVRTNARALPTLRTEVLTAQTAHVDTVSGATYTSDAYTRSLQSAIDQARAAGTTTIA